MMSRRLQIDIALVAALLMLLLLSAGCSTSDPAGEVILPGEEEENEVLITHYEIANSLTAYPSQKVTLFGRGFQDGDILHFVDSAHRFAVSMTASAAYHASFILPAEVREGTYTLTLNRGNKSQLLGEMKLILTLNPNAVGDKEGATIKGIVYSGVTPLPGVRVSDGVITTTTDANGHYWLNSRKEKGYVFLSLPSGYEAESAPTRSLPGFWHTTENDAGKLEQHNFHLVKRDNKRHTLIVGSDIHVSAGKLNKDIERFKTGFLAEAGTFVNSRSTDQPVYTFILGDMSHDLYWYSNQFDIFSYKSLLENYPSPLFHIMGNHDNDPYIANDQQAEHAYRRAFGPTYYSHNMGEVHYIMLDNSVYVNKGGSQGVVGDRSIQQYIDPVQLQWLKEDLAAIADKNAPLIIGMHCPAYSNNRDTTFTNQPAFEPASKTSELTGLLHEFTQVHLLSGHIHHNANMVISDQLFEHNVASICETWWWGGRLTETPICKDGTPAGYALYEINGKEISWKYKSIGKEADKQFRSYDMNTVKALFENPEIIALLARYSNRGDGRDYKNVADDAVLINVWNYDPQWDITVTEAGSMKKLPGKRVLLRDPLHTYCYEIQRWNRVDKTISNSHASTPSAHMFIVETDSPNSTLEITVTDRFGAVYKETMRRPGKFDPSLF